MKHKEKLVELFKKILHDSDLKCYSKNRKLSEFDYFDAYLDFIDNSFHYSRFKTVVKGIQITGKYLNEKVNKWINHNIFYKMYTVMLDEYKKKFKSNTLHIDGKIITNKLCTDSSKMGRNTRYKSKKSINLQAITDEFGIPSGFGILKGSASEISNMIDVLNKINIEDVNYSKKSNKHKKYFTADAGYNSKENVEYLTKKGYSPLIWNNPRNTKNKKLLEKKKLKGKKLEKYKKRHIIENFFSWMESKIPRLGRIYDKKIKNYLNTIYMSSTMLIFGRMCV
jgi:hypothetical protein